MYIIHIILINNILNYLLFILYFCTILGGRANEEAGSKFVTLDF